MSQKTVRFANPPVIERVLGLQFEPLGMTAGHLGWFWKEYLGKEWTKPSSAPRLLDQFESFGKAAALNLPEFHFETRSSPPVDRLQISTADADRMLQVQDTRLVYNWIRKSDDYPRYETIAIEFEHWFRRFQEFASHSGLAAVELNQWEVTYVNHIKAGPLWSSPADWPKVIPGLLLNAGSFGGTQFERMSGEWHSEIPDKQGRLHVIVQFQQRETEGVLVLNLSARGPIHGGSVSEGLKLGHDTIVQAFDQMTSPAAHKLWGKE